MIQIATPEPFAHNLILQPLLILSIRTTPCRGTIRSLSLLGIKIYFRQAPGRPWPRGVGQSNPGVKRRFYDAGEAGLSVSVSPQLFLNNPGDAVRRGITPASQFFRLPVEFSKKFGPVGVDYEAGHQFVRKGPNGWINGLVLGHDFTKKVELDMEIYSQGTFHPSGIQPTVDIGGRYKLHSPIIILFMAGRSFEPTRPNQPYVIGYFGIQLLLPPKSYKSD